MSQHIAHRHSDEIHELRAEIERLRADKENWQKVCEGALKEQFRLADKRELEARLELALRELDKAAAEIERLNALNAELLVALRPFADARVINAVMRKSARAAIAKVEGIK